MADKTGTITGTTNNEYITAKIDWEQTKDIINNTSTIRTKCYLKKSSASTAATSGTFTFFVTIDGGTALSNSGSYTFNNNNTWVLCLDKSKVVSHGIDGSKSCTIDFYMNTSSTSLDYIYCDDTVTLDSIPRASTVSITDTDMNLGDSAYINATANVAGWTHNFSYSFGTAIDVTGGLSASTGVASPSHITFTPPASLAGNLTTATSGTCTVKCTTYNGTTFIGSKTTTLTLRIPDTATYNPTLNSLTITKINPLGTTLVQGKSKIKGVIDATGKYGATLSYLLSVQGQNYALKDATSNILNQSGRFDVSGKVTDSRGRIAVTKTTIDVSAYSVPTIFLSAYRSDVNNNNDPSQGTFIRTLTTASVSPVNTTKTYKVSYRKKGNSTWITKTLSTTVNSLTNSSWRFGDATGETASILNALDYEYEVIGSVQDSYTTITTPIITIPAGFVLMDFHNSGTGMAIGTTSDSSGLLEVDLSTQFNKTVDISGDTQINGNVQVSGNYIGTIAKLLLSYSRPTSYTLTANVAYDVTGFTYTPDYNELLIFNTEYGFTRSASTNTYINTYIRNSTTANNQTAGQLIANPCVVHGTGVLPDAQVQIFPNTFIYPVSAGTTYNFKFTAWGDGTGNTIYHTYTRIRILALPA